MSIQFQKLKILIDTAVCDLKIRHRPFVSKLLHQRRTMERYLARIENYECISEESANRPVKFILSIKKTIVSNIKNTPNFTQHPLVTETDESDMAKNVIELLKGIQIVEKQKRNVKNDRVLKMMSAPVYHRCIRVIGIRGVLHLSCVTLDRIWISDWNNKLILSNKAGEYLKQIKDIQGSVWGAHTLNTTGDLIYIDRDYNINKLSKDIRTGSTLIKKTVTWTPQCVHCSTSNGDLLIGMWHTYNYRKAKINRYNQTGQHLQTTQHNKSGQELYSEPKYITENRNGDVIVSDDYRGVVVTDGGGSHRFFYTGPPSGSRIHPRGVCTDALSNILVCDVHTDTVQMIDKDGNFLTLIRTQQQEIYKPRGIGYDEKTHHLLVGSLNFNRLCVYRYLERR
ncbi:uncharacterized protein LOC133180690 [Saccostrea echinata]|uniref:uncharacterized protein LOC133180690 n=1 Tax=Saccostrea echinata TaxID=191078 RepID=UPI002A834E44|nr:uncharacterized protein LOC133180690 [Saccostrea echinata]